jgi:hypothetical protein
MLRYSAHWAIGPVIVLRNSLCLPSLQIIKVGRPSTQSRLLRFPSPDAAAAVPARSRGSVGAGVLPCPSGYLPGAPRAGGGLEVSNGSVRGRQLLGAVMAAAGGGREATTSGCGLKRRYAPHDQEVRILPFLLVTLLLLVFARLLSTHHA